MGRGLLQGLQEGVKGFGGEHVHFMDDVDLIAATSWCEADLIPQIPHLFNARFLAASISIISSDDCRMAVQLGQALQGFFSPVPVQLRLRARSRATVVFQPLGGQ